MGRLKKVDHIDYAERRGSFEFGGYRAGQTVDLAALFDTATGRRGGDAHHVCRTAICGR